MNVSPMLTRDDDGTRRLRSAEGDILAAQPFDGYPGRTDAMVQILGRAFSCSAVLTVPELRALARACDEVADQVERKTMRRVA